MGTTSPEAARGSPPWPRRRQWWGDGAEGRTTKGGNEWWGKWLREVGEMAIDEADDSVCATARARIGLPDDPGCCAPFYTRF